MPELSHRGQALVDSPPMPEYIMEHFGRASSPWDARTNPTGYIGLCIAENKLDNDAFIAELSVRTAPPRVLGYDAMGGNLQFRERLAGFLGHRILGRPCTAEDLVVLAGAGSVLEMLGYVLGNPGDGILIPTPSYAGFWPDFETRDGLNVIPVHCSGANGFELTTAHLDRALAAADCPVKALLLTSPNNPLGNVCSRDHLREIVAWSEHHGVHLIADEIYALSVFGEREFTSVAALRPHLGDSIHIVWAFSKDFGASGLRCGVLVSENRAVTGAIEALAYWSACSTHTQYLLSAFIADEAAVDRTLATMRANLRRAYIIVTTELDRAGISCIPAEAAFFLVCDLRAHLETPTFAAEHDLWRRILERANVNLTPGAACRINEPGYFRLCYAATNGDAVVEAVKRIGRVLKQRL